MSPENSLVLSNHEAHPFWQSSPGRGSYWCLQIPLWRKAHWAHGETPLPSKDRESFSSHETKVIVEAFCLHVTGQWRDTGERDWCKDTVNTIISVLPRPSLRQWRRSQPPWRNSAALCIAHDWTPDGACVLRTSSPRSVWRCKAAPGLAC